MPVDLEKGRARLRRYRKSHPEYSAEFYRRKEAEKRRRFYDRVYENARSAGGEYSDAVQNGTADFISPFDDPDPHYR